MATYEQVMMIVGVVAASYPTFQLKAETVSVYADMLADVDADLLSIAAKQAMAESKFFPTIAELRERVMSMRRQASGLPDAYSAWDEVMREVGRVGFESWADTRWSCDLAKDMARRFWRDVCLGDVDGINTMRAQFRDAYNAQVNRAEATARNLPCTNDAIKRLAEGLAEGLSMSTPRLKGGVTHEY